jgi:hypothetical protein
MFLGSRARPVRKADNLTDCVNNTEPSTSHYPIGLYGLVERLLHIFTLFVPFRMLYVSIWNKIIWDEIQVMGGGGLVHLRNVTIVDYFYYLILHKLLQQTYFCLKMVVRPKHNRLFLLLNTT